MPVYVDDAQMPLGRMKMCHMLADTREELEAMMAKINLPKSATIQLPGEVNEHVDISMTYRTKAVRAGAIEVDDRHLVKIIRRKRRGDPPPAPVTGELKFTDEEEAPEAVDEFVYGSDDTNS